jgi:hypothetical protein
MFRSAGLARRGSSQGQEGQDRDKAFLRIQVENTSRNHYDAATSSRAGRLEADVHRSASRNSKNVRVVNVIILCYTWWQEDVDLPRSGPTAGMGRLRRRPWTARGVQPYGEAKGKPFVGVSMAMVASGANLVSFREVQEHEEKRFGPDSQ